MRIVGLHLLIVLLLLGGCVALTKGGWCGDRQGHLPLFELLRGSHVVLVVRLLDLAVAHLESFANWNSEGTHNPTLAKPLYFAPAILALIVELSLDLQSMSLAQVSGFNVLLQKLLLLESSSILGLLGAFPRLELVFVGAQIRRKCDRLAATRWIAPGSQIAQREVMRLLLLMLLLQEQLRVLHH